MNIAASGGMLFYVSIWVNEGYKLLSSMKKIIYKYKDGNEDIEGACIDLNCGL